MQPAVRFSNVEDLIFYPPDTVERLTRKNNHIYCRCYDDPAPPGFANRDEFDAWCDVCDEYNRTVKDVIGWLRDFDIIVKAFGIYNDEEHYESTFEWSMWIEPSRKFKYMNEEWIKGKVNEVLEFYQQVRDDFMQYEERYKEFLVEDKRFRRLL